MCLAIPAKILSTDKTTARASVSGVLRTIDIRLVPGAGAGDYVLVHAGFGIEKIDRKEAKKTLRALRELAASASRGRKE